MRKNSETAKYSNSVGGRFGFTFPSGVGLKTGFNISTIRRGFSFDENDGMGTSSTPNIITNTNKYTYIDVPVLFSYEMAGFGQFYYNVNFGVLFNMTFTGDGKFIAPNGSVVDFTRGIEGNFRAYERTVGASLFASFGMHYVINKTFDFILEPNIRYGLGPITTNDYELSEKYTTVGLITGIRYKF